MPRVDACDAYRRKESRRRKWRQGIKENKCGTCKWRFRHLASDITQVLILAASDQSGRNFRDVDAENVSAESGAGDAHDHDDPWVEMKQQQQHHQNRPCGWREDGDAIDSQRGDENEDIHPHDRLYSAGPSSTYYRESMAQREQGRCRAHTHCTNMQDEVGSS